MADNVVKFRRIEKKPEPKAPQPQKQPPKLPGWLPWAGIVVLAVVLTAVSYPAAFGL